MCWAGMCCWWIGALRFGASELRVRMESDLLCEMWYALLAVTLC